MTGIQVHLKSEPDVASNRYQPDKHKNNCSMPSKEDAHRKIHCKISELCPCCIHNGTMTYIDDNQKDVPLITFRMKRISFPLKIGLYASNLTCAKDLRADINGMVVRNTTTWNHSWVERQKVALWSGQTNTQGSGRRSLWHSSGERKVLTTRMSAGKSSSSGVLWLLSSYWSNRHGQMEGSEYRRGENNSIFSSSLQFKYAPIWSVHA